MRAGKLDDGRTPWTDASNITTGTLGNDRFDALSDLGGGSGDTYLQKNGEWTTPTLTDDDWTISGNDMYSVVAGSVGIGTTSPQYKLHVEIGSG